MKSKAIEYGIGGLVIGAILGILAAFGALNMTKASMRGTMLLPALGICGIGFAAMGYVKGSSLGRAVDLEIKLGHDKLQENIYQQGQVWVAITEWTSMENQTYKLITGQTKDKLVISQLNDKLVMNHELNSGSQVNVVKFHKEARNYIFNQQKAQYTV